MAFALRRQEDVLIGIINELKDSGINFLPRGSKAQAVARALSKEFDIAYRFFDSNFDAAFLNNATGDLLEALGVLFGVRRITARRAVVSTFEQNIAFYVNSSIAFGDINSGSDFIIPAGTMIQTPDIISGQPRIEYQILSDVTCRSTDTVAFAAAEALVDGSSSNLGRHSLIEHNFTGYTDAANESLKVTNRFGIINGTDREPDSRLRARISIAATALQAGNLAAIRFALLAVPGVVDIRLLRYHDGIGTVGAFIAGQDNEITPSLLAQGQASVNNYTSGGEVVTVYSPNRVGVEFQTHVNLSREITVNERSQIERKLLDNVNTLFTGLAIGDDIPIGNLVTAMQRSDNLIVNFGTDPYTSQFDELYIYRYSDASGERVRQSLLNTATSIDIEDHEIFIPELSISHPFSFTFDPIS